MKKQSQILFSLLAAAALVGCSSPVKLDEPAKVEDRTPPPPVSKPAQPEPKPMADSAVKRVDIDAEQTAAVSDKRVVYFDFDSYVVKDEYRGVVEAHAKRLGISKAVRLNLEGHADERGGREYNLALGQKRAEAVAKSLSLLGVAAERYEPVSFGKERPAVQGSTEEAWAKNRRVELQDKK
ncbi:peptidoglycan-associated lipoprotein Pal [Pelomonas sp. SE-A7]|uniref:peptidoglycan-associated lipoprotein Pal n=1 Tax=Pelomonas sp. SE-A7 TaxID=3054953 RepID=UPI00259D1AF0|nr:peptidoglycan-associated lipoprotein Pal [Pelomonas sp. SE-A7]MDM4765883.1 peptidoglycan-associated lipoprotein Pal [Pelomonas sp. SE-A7]